MNLLKRISIFIHIVFSTLCISQEFNKNDFEGLISSQKSLKQKRIYIDSLIQISRISEEDKSYVYHRYASLLHKNDEQKGSIYFLKKAIGLRKRNQKRDLISLKKSMFNLGLYHKRYGYYFKAIRAQKELIKLPKEDRIKTKAYSELIILYIKTGDFEKGKLFYQKSTDYYKKVKDYRNLYKNHMRMSKVYAVTGGREHFDKVLYYLQKADSLRKYTTIELRDDAIINLRLGNVYVDVNEVDKAEQHYNKALAISEKLQDSLTISLLTNNIADLYINNTNTKRLSDAKEMLERSIIYAGDNKSSKALAYSTFGSYYTTVKQFSKAIDYYEKAIQLQVTGNNSRAYVNPDIAKLATRPNKLRLYEYILQKAVFWFNWHLETSKKEYLQNALTDYKLADKLLDVIRFESSEKKSKLFWREKGADLYMKAVEVSYKLNDVATAYYFMEKNKALLLLEELNNQKAQVLSKLPEKLIERDFSFKEKIIEAEESNHNNKLDKIFELKRAYEQFKDSIARKFPAYSKLKKSLPILSIKAHKQYFVTDKKATLQYIVNKNGAYGLIITKERTSLFKLKNITELQGRIVKLTDQLQQPFNTKSEVAIYVENAFQVFQNLMPNEEFKIIKGKELTVAADGLVQNIPFEALITNTKTENAYLIKSNEINYVYSFSYLNSNRNKLRTPQHTFLGMAPNKFSDNFLAELPNSESEIKDINAIFSDKILINEQATKLNFKENFEAYKIVHLATHSGMNNLEIPWLAFNDGKLSLNEVYATQNQADLVVLSACKTSQGKLKAGEGVMSLARGFFFSGTNSVVATLWNINDKTSQKLMHSFYVNLKKGLTKSKSLHQAKLAYLKTHSGTMASPFYWSSFVLIGDADAINLEGNDHLISAFFLLLAIIAFLIFFKIKNSIK